MTNENYIDLPAIQFEDHDDCLAAAVADYLSSHETNEPWRVSAEWVDGEEGPREWIRIRS